jgi:tetraacyldisaccharide 4'-kinase
MTKPEGSTAIKESKLQSSDKTAWLQQTLEHIWYQGGSDAFLLKPLEGLYRVLAFLNKRSSLKKQIHHPVPVIVVGNISVGGTGKTPLVVYLAQLLQEAGYKPGIITRGYGGSATHWPALVTPDSNPAEYGDEPVLMAQRSGVPVVAGPDRNADVDALLKLGSVDIVISDDGLQHYRLKRDIEIVVIDGERGLGNEHCLPAGPLREPKSRLKSCDIVVVNEREASAEYSMQLCANQVHRLNSGFKQPLSEWRGQQVHAVTGIGNPKRFFKMLTEFGLKVTEHGFPDHHAFSSDDIKFGDEVPVLMTEKDAVKCRSFAMNHHWFVPISGSVGKNFDDKLLALLK